MVKKNINSEKTIFIIDGSSFLYRAYYGLKPIHTTHGVPVQAVYNFCRMIKKMIDEYNPHYLVIAWDSKGPTERHELFSEYKATRQLPPSDLFEQKNKIVEFASLIGITQVEQSGIEADDLMYSIARDAEANGFDAILITSDKDMGQMLTDKIVMFDWFKQEFIDAAVLEKKMGFAVSKLVFYYALIGDSSDNIPGVKGIGKVGATQLVNEFDSLKDLYKNLDKVKKERTLAALKEHKEDAFLSENLFSLRYHALKKKIADYQFNSSHWANALELFQELEFKSLLKGIELPQQERTFLSHEKGYSFVAITKSEELRTLIARLEEKKLFAFDAETDGLNGLNCNLVGISICVEPGTAYYIPCGHHTMEEQIPLDDLLQALKPIFANESIKKYLQHTKFDQLVLSQYGVHVAGVVFDTMIAAPLVTKDWQRINLKYLSEFYLNETMLTFADAVTRNGYKNFAQLPIALATEYAAADAHQTYRLVSILEAELKKQQLEKLFYEIELPLAQILFEMEKEGIVLDCAVLKKLDKLVTKDLAEIEQKIGTMVDLDKTQLNLNSPKQLEKLLFYDLKLPTGQKTKTGFSTNQEVLEALAKIHPVPGLIIAYRELFKLKSTYIDALPGYVNPKDGKVHTSFSQTSVATGRLSSSDPNLQNVPVHTKGYEVQVRTAFEPEVGSLFVSADYSQIELRVLAFLSGDENLKQAFLNNVDVHTQTASKLFDVSLESVSHDQRQMGKRINFSILYGLTPYGLSKDLDIPFAQAKGYIEKYFAQYPQVSRWMEGVIEETKQLGYVTTYWGRRRYLPGIYEKNKALYELACRVAINTKAQGTAAELMKLGMIQLAKELRVQEPKAKMILQIHDELLIAAPEGQENMVCQLAKQVLESVVDWPVPLVVDTCVGKNWQEASE
jgi:DNA polymerase-1